MKGLRKVNADLVGFVQSRSPQTEATVDATLVETRKHEALPSHKKYRAYQPLITYWSEAELTCIRSLGTATYLRAISSCECWLKHWSICHTGGKGDAAV